MMQTDPTLVDRYPDAATGFATAANWVRSTREQRRDSLLAWSPEQLAQLYREFSSLDQIIDRSFYVELNDAVEVRWLSKGLPNAFAEAVRAHVSELPEMVAHLAAIDPHVRAFMPPQAWEEELARLQLEATTAEASHKQRAEEYWRDRANIKAQMTSVLEFLREKFGKDVVQLALEAYAAQMTSGITDAAQTKDG